MSDRLADLEREFAEVSAERDAVMRRYVDLADAIRAERQRRVLATTTVTAVHDATTGLTTIKRIPLWGNVLDTYRTEAELNGFRPEQGRML